MVGEIVDAWTARGPAGRRPPRPLFVERTQAAVGDTCRRLPVGLRAGGSHSTAWSRSSPTSRRWWSSGGTDVQRFRDALALKTPTRPSTGTGSRVARAGEGAAAMSGGPGLTAGATPEPRLGAGTVARSRRSRAGGMVGPECRIPGSGELMQVLEEHGVEVSISSLARTPDEEMVASLKRGGPPHAHDGPGAGRAAARGDPQGDQRRAAYEACELLRPLRHPNLKCYL